jgi:hypothetical protein
VRVTPIVVDFRKILGAHSSRFHARGGLTPLTLPDETGPFCNQSEPRVWNSFDVRRNNPFRHMRELVAGSAHMTEINWQKFEAYIIREPIVKNIKIKIIIKIRRGAQRRLTPCWNERTNPPILNVQRVPGSSQGWVTTSRIVDDL